MLTRHARDVLMLGIGAVVVHLVRFAVDVLWLRRSPIYPH